MDRIVINGGRRLEGGVTVNGAKNAALPLLAATLLCDGPTLLHRVPRLTDVMTMLDVLRGLGMRVEWVGPTSVRATPLVSGCVRVPAALACAMRASICVLGPLLARRGAARVPLPGGCVIGPRPIDLHLHGLRALRARVRVDDDGVRADCRRLCGADVSMLGSHGTTVLGTANVLMGAVLARGRTRIRHAAFEPEVQDLCAFLRAAGARIDGVGSGELIVDGVERLGGVEHTVIPDRIEGGTFMVACAATGGCIELNGLRMEHVGAVVEVLTRMGVQITERDGCTTVRREKPLAPIHLETAPYPGVPTDMQPQLSVLLCLAAGRSLVTENVYPDRFTHLDELQRMGADILRAGSGAVVNGVKALHGAPVHAADLRAGAAMVVAGLAAGGETCITGTDQIDRGYSDLEARLCGLGADVRREAVPEDVRRTA
jgi:UDP-N-acetylglucosamine 1-carboxyvinyltransferase